MIQHSNEIEVTNGCEFAAGNIQGGERRNTHTALAKVLSSSRKVTHSLL